MANQGTQVSCIRLIRAVGWLLSCAAPCVPRLCVLDGSELSNSSHAFTHVTSYMAQWTCNQMHQPQNLHTALDLQCMHLNSLMGLAYGVIQAVARTNPGMNRAVVAILSVLSII